MGRALRLAAAVGVGTVLLAGSSAAQPLRTGLASDPEFIGPDADLAYTRTREAGATLLRVTVDWAEAAPMRPSNPTNPADPAYDWRKTDEQVRMALAHGLQPVLSLDDAPLWAQDRSKPLPFTPNDPTLAGPIRPDPQAYGEFARAVATRFDGSFAGLPRVRYWRAWNEPNLSIYLLPQFSGNRALSPTRYRNLLNAFATSVHAVRSDNVVVAGGLSPYGIKDKPLQAVAPLRFMRELLCMSGRSTFRPTCKNKVAFDAWAVHPYTPGGPTRHATYRDDVALGDMPEIRSLVDAAVRAGHVVSRAKPELWVTEFSWDTKPPDRSPFVVPIKLHARWVAEALYHLWEDGVQVVTWLQLRDDPYPTSISQSGLYFRGHGGLATDAPKPALAAFRFPFVAYRENGWASLWGRTPRERAAYVSVEQNSGGGWRRIGQVRADRYGIFTGRLKLAPEPKRKRAGPVRRPQRAPTYRETVLRDSPRSYWSFDDASRSVARDQAGAKDARYIGSPKSVPGAIGGTLDRAVSLNGKQQAVDLGGMYSPRTVELWVKTTDYKEAAAFSNRSSISRQVSVGVIDGVRARSFDTSGLFGRSWITDGRWHYLAYTYDGVSGRLYVDGRLDASAAYPRFEGGAEGWIGYDATLKTHLRGAVDEVAVYDYALSPAQIQSHFLASGRPAGYADQFAIMNGGQTYLRARLVRAGVASLPFSLRRPPDRFVEPFGL